MLKKIAPPELIRQDYRHLKSVEKLNTTEEIEDLIFIQSMEGRAHNGAGLFRKMYYVNTTIDDIVKALGRETRDVKTKRQRLIDDIFAFARDTIEAKHREYLVNEKNEPFLGVSEFLKQKVNAHDILAGLYIGGLRDDAETRKVAEERYKVTIGYGKCYLVNTEVMDRMGLDGEALAHEAHEDELGRFRKEGLILGEDGEADEATTKYMYIRHKLGPGQSDDAAIVTAGLLYNRDTALGVFLSDAIDTLEKYVIHYRDQDDEIAYYIRDNYQDLDISMDEVYELTYLAAVPEEEEETTPDSSLRYFLTVDNRTGQSALESHLAFVEDKPFYPMHISYNRVLNTEFYEYIKKRATETKLRRIISEPAMKIRGLDISVEDLMRRSVAVVGQNTTLRDLIEKMLSMKTEIAVVQDEEKNILGVISPQDFLHLLTGTK